jgi:hypothetical protein
MDDAMKGVRKELRMARSSADFFSLSSSKCLTGRIDDDRLPRLDINVYLRAMSVVTAIERELKSGKKTEKTRTPAKKGKK